MAKLLASKEKKIPSESFNCLNKELEPIKGSEEEEEEEVEEEEEKSNSCPD